MKEIKNTYRTRAQVSSAAIERMYITMRHLFNRGFTNLWEFPGIL
jgi:hypothetical protein